MAGRLLGIEMGKWFKPPLIRREKQRLSLEGSKLIEGGLVCLLSLILGPYATSLYPINIKAVLVNEADIMLIGNTRVISQTALDHFRTALSAQKQNPYSVLLRRNKLPMGLLEDESKTSGKVGFYCFHLIFYHGKADTS